VLRDRSLSGISMPTSAVPALVEVLRSSEALMTLMCVNRWLCQERSTLPTAHADPPLVFALA